MPSIGGIERILKRDRLVVLAALSAIIAASWAYVLAGAGMGMSAFGMSSLSMALGQSPPMPMAQGMGSMAHAMGGAMGAMATPVAWTADYAVLMFFMWWIMMIAMMLPSAAPMVLLHAALTRKSSLQAESDGAPWATATFTFGYLAAWAAFSIVAVALQWRFEEAGVLSPMTLNSTNALFAAAILLFAGIYQLTPLKQACLKHCRGPVEFLTRHWRPGAGGAFAMGLQHGAYCLGCCWGLMAILFFGGIMNLYWIIGLALLVLAEKTLPHGPWIGRATGVALLAGSGIMFSSAAGAF
jgi:predicted metal-binding membrane protein